MKVKINIPSQDKNMPNLVASAGMQFAGYQFLEMPTTLKVIDESLYVATNVVLANVS